MDIFRKKSVDELRQTSYQEAPFRRELQAWQLTLLGVGCIVGAGVFVLTGTAVAVYAGPAIALSFVISALGCLCAALCYAEFASLLPVAGSAYTYAYATLGEFVAWIIGWDLLLEYVVGGSTVAVGWSAYFSQLLGDLGIHIPTVLSQAPSDFVQDHFGSLLICTILYVLVSLVLTGVVNYKQLNVSAPVVFAVQRVGPAVSWTKTCIELGSGRWP